MLQQATRVKSRRMQGVKGVKPRRQWWIVALPAALAFGTDKHAWLECGVREFATPEEGNASGSS